MPTVYSITKTGSHIQTLMEFAENNTIPYGDIKIISDTATPAGIFAGTEPLVEFSSTYDYFNSVKVSTPIVYQFVIGVRQTASAHKELRLIKKNNPSTYINYYNVPGDDDFRIGPIEMDNGAKYYTTPHYFNWERLPHTVSLNARQNKVPPFVLKFSLLDITSTVSQIVSSTSADAYYISSTGQETTYTWISRYIKSAGEYTYAYGQDKELYLNLNPNG